MELLMLSQSPLANACSRAHRLPITVFVRIRISGQVLRPKQVCHGTPAGVSFQYSHPISPPVYDVSNAGNPQPRRHYLAPSIHARVNPSREHRAYRRESHYGHHAYQHHREYHDCKRQSPAHDRVERHRALAANRVEFVVVGTHSVTPARLATSFTAPRDPTPRTFIFVKIRISGQALRPKRVCHGTPAGVSIQFSLPRSPPVYNVANAGYTNTWRQYLAPTTKLRVHPNDKLGYQRPEHRYGHHAKKHDREQNDRKGSAHADNFSQTSPKGRLSRRRVRKKVHYSVTPARPATSRKASGIPSHEPSSEI